MLGIQACTTTYDFFSAGDGTQGFNEHAKASALPTKPRAQSGCGFSNPADISINKACFISRKKKKILTTTGGQVSPSLLEKKM